MDAYCPCFNGKESLRFTLDTLLPLLAAASERTRFERNPPPEIIIVIDQTKFVFKNGNDRFNTGMYSLTKAESQTREYSI